jgi:hypothetical protein
MPINYKTFVLMLLLSFSGKTFSWEKEEHRILADIAFDSTLSFCGINFNDSLIFFPGKTGIISVNKKLWNDQSFGNTSAFFSGDDILQSHCQLREKSIYQQLKPLSASYIDKVWSGIKETPDDIQSIEVSNQNAVFNYLLYHLIALRFARLSGNEVSGDNEDLHYALIYEAAAQSYLSDAFSSGHMLLSNSDFLAPLNSFNIQIAHDHYCSEGVYVINSNGNCWQAFGDKLLQWYPYSFNQVFQACNASLRELFLVYFTSTENVELPANLEKWASSISPGITPEALSNLWVTVNDGIKYYSEIKMPALLYIPIPVAAAWSVRTDMKDEYGIHLRKNYPQLMEEKYYDPDLDEVDLGFLYSKYSMPGWMIPDFLPCDSLQNLIRYNPEIASVHFVQNRNFPPSFKGYLLTAGVTYVFINDNNEVGSSLGFGWGFGDLSLLVFIKPTVFVTAMRLLGDSQAWILSADIGVGINASVFGICKPYIELGSSWGSSSPYNGYAGNYALGLDSETLPLGFTYAGLTFRLKYEFKIFNKTLHSPVLEIILH